MPATRQPVAPEVAEAWAGPASAVRVAVELEDVLAIDRCGECQGAEGLAAHVAAANTNNGSQSHTGEQAEQASARQPRVLSWQAQARSDSHTHQTNRHTGRLIGAGLHP